MTASAPLLVAIAVALLASSRAFAQVPAPVQIPAEVLVTPPDATPYLHGTWQVRWTQYGAVVTVLPETQPSITFEADSRVRGTTGCNTFMGTYIADASSVVFGPLAMTRRACASDAANAQEQAFMAALGETSSYELLGDQLTLRDATGATQLVLIASPVSGG